ncbi:MAG TPA: 2-C-methyl-D-erythritol 4-phosphate cytidylyltransferase [Bacillota bacterium]|nr:2-C-methyl-D-erythritol 4-phosphate cytidylyltransferase [Bacillota bacterium]
MLNNFKTEDAYAIILAAGKGSRMGAAENKVFLPLGDATVLNHSCLAFEDLAEIKAYIVCAAPAEMERVKKLLPEDKYSKLLAVVPGGDSRTESVRAGIDWLSAQDIPSSSKILIHDGARALVPPDVILRCLTALEQEVCAVAAAIPVTDTIRQIDRHGWINSSPDRELLRAMQTPQGARLNLLRESLSAPQNEKCRASDDLDLLRQIGCPVRLVQGDTINIKITTKVDLYLAEILINERP